MPTPEALGEIAPFFRLLAEPMCPQLLCQLQRGPMDVASLIQAMGFSRSHISRRHGLLTARHESFFPAACLLGDR